MARIVDAALAVEAQRNLIEQYAGRGALRPLGGYLSLYGLTFTISLALGPAIGGFLLQTSPDAIWWGGALAAVLAGAVLLRPGGSIPDPLREAQSRLASAPDAA